MEERKIELHSPAVQEIFGKPPRWIFSWGISLIVVVLTVFSLVFFCWRVPERISVQIVSQDLQEGWVLISTQDADKVKSSKGLYGEFNNADTNYWYKGKILNCEFVENHGESCCKISFCTTESGILSAMSSEMKTSEESFLEDVVYFIVREKTIYKFLVTEK